MAKHNLIVRVSKTRSLGGYHFSFGNHAVQLPPNGKLPPKGSEEHEDIKKKVEHILRNMFQRAAEEAKVEGGLSYKFIFSDKFVFEGKAAPKNYSGGERIETYHELTLPMNEEECLLFFGCTPWGY